MGHFLSDVSSRALRTTAARVFFDAGFITTE
jgi:hypothetical protein